MMAEATVSGQALRPVLVEAKLRTDRKKTDGEVATLGLGTASSGCNAGDGPGVNVARGWGTGVNMAEEFTGIPHPFENLWPVGRPYTWMYEESDPDGGSSLFMVWVISQFTDERMVDPEELPEPAWVAGPS